jgi:hypothetical protein
LGAGNNLEELRTLCKLNSRLNNLNVWSLSGCWSASAVVAMGADASGAAAADS